MIRRLRFGFFLFLALITGAALWSLLRTRAENQRADEVHSALRKTTEFLKPDTTSDLRFGNPKPSGTPAPATAIPTPRTP